MTRLDPFSRHGRARRGLRRAPCRARHCAGVALLACALADVVPLGAEEPSRWAVSIDNDALTGATDDRDYTAGVSAALAGPAARRYAALGYRALEWLDRQSGAARLHRSPHAAFHQDGVQLGVLMFTPDDIASSDLMPGDRPYANVLFLEHSHYGLDSERRVMYESTFAVGVIGSRLAARFHEQLHELAGDAEPRGYRYQVSNGGELTARYGFARHAQVAAGGGGRRRHDVHYTLGASAGYLTEAVASLGLRWGTLGSPWWTGMHAGSYGIGGAASRFDGLGLSGSSYLWAGLMLRARLYNALLQGQFRSSALTLDGANLERFVLEAGVGFTKDFGALELTYALRLQTPEVASGLAARNVAWAGITVSGNR